MKIETNQNSFEYAWKWFEYHAEQRMQIVRFFIVSFAFICAAYGKLIYDQYYFLAILAGGMGLCISFAFYRLDRRVAFLIKLGEGSLQFHEDIVAKEINNDGYSILRNVNKKKIKY